MARLSAFCLLLVVGCVHALKATTREGVVETRPKSLLQRARTKAATSWRCVGDASNRTCLFKNLYYARTAAGANNFAMFVTERPETMPKVVRADKYDYPWAPSVQTFPSSKEMDDHLASKAVLAQPGLSAQFNPLFHQNIGHALFDGLYPAYMALVKLGFQDKEFRPVVGVPSDCFDTSSPASHGALEPGDVVEAYLPHPRYNKSLQPSKVEVLQVTQKSGGTSDGMLCSFEAGLDSTAFDLGSQPVSPGVSGQAECCKACEKAFGCTRGVIWANVCFLKGKCLNPVGCDVTKQERLLCRFHEDRRPQADVSVRLVSDVKGSAAKSEATIPVEWVLDRVRDRCMSEGIFKTFGKSNSMLRLFEMDRDIRANPNLVFRFDEIVIGSGGAGNMVADKSGAIGGSSAPINAMAHFRDRMLEAYQLPSENGKNLPDPPDPNKPLDVIVVSNKRFNENDKAALDAVLEAVRHPGKVNAEFIDWRTIGTPENKFREHLRRVQQADVYVSSIGTALQYVPFLKNQRVYVALGSVWQRSNQLFPTFMEQQLAGGGTPYLTTLYADPGAYLRSGLSTPQMLGEDGFRVNVNTSSVLSLLGQAMSLVRQGFQIPVPIEQNLSQEGKLLVELCKQDPDSCNSMQADRNGAIYECATMVWPECVVYEAGPWRSKCTLNRPLLRQLRKKYGLFSYGAPEV